MDFEYTVKVSLPVPDDCDWVSRDADGSWWASPAMPIRNRRKCQWALPEGGRHSFERIAMSIELPKTSESFNWEEELYQRTSEGWKNVAPKTTHPPLIPGASVLKVWDTRDEPLIRVFAGWTTVPSGRRVRCFAADEGYPLTWKHYEYVGELIDLIPENSQKPS